MIDFRQLIDAGLHFGHQKSRWCPKMKPFIWGHRGGIHLIDISKTAFALQKASVFLESIVARGETVLWVGTKKSAKEVIGAVGRELKMPYVDYRWVGGTITNYAQVKKAVTKLLHYEDILARAESDSNMYTKKELGRFQKLADRLRRSVGGLKDLRMPIGAIVLIDVKKEQTALFEASVANIPVVALVDTNGDPSGINFVIPGNDDSTKGIRFVVEYLKDAVKKGLAQKVLVQKQAKQNEEFAAASKEKHEKQEKKEVATEKLSTQTQVASDKKDLAAKKSTEIKKRELPLKKKLDSKPKAKAE
ncbi:30S ribosomal protein S2 [Candidatus Dependentiae bacterium]|nr:30S ribosomal protein S2 [Candidatus Dependentiae bacterium]